MNPLKSSPSRVNICCPTKLYLPLFGIWSLSVRPFAIHSSVCSLSSSNQLDIIDRFYGNGYEYVQGSTDEKVTKSVFVTLIDANSNQMFFIVSLLLVNPIIYGDGISFTADSLDFGVIDLVQFG